MADEVPISRRRGFTVISNTAAQDERLSLAARGFLLYITSLSNSWVYRPRHLQRKSNIGRDKYYGIIRELKEAGYLVIERAKDASGRYVGANWKIIDEPCPEKPDTAGPDFGKSDHLEKKDSVQKKYITPDDPAEPGPKTGNGSNATPNSSEEEAPSRQLAEGCRLKAEGHFEEFWRLHPRPRDRRHSLWLFRRAVERGVDPKQLVHSARAYALQVKDTERQYVATSANWLDQRRWEELKDRQKSSADVIRDAAAYWANIVRLGKHVPPSAISAAVANQMIAECGITEKELRILGVSTGGAAS